MITIEKENFSISQICASGQCFRLNPIEGTEKFYELTAGDRYLKIEVLEDPKEAKAPDDGEKAENSVGKVRFYCTQEEFEQVWKGYFDLDTCYNDYLSLIKGDEYLRKAAQFGSGIRILRQDLWEMIVTFLLSQQSNIPRIKMMIQNISRQYGDRKETYDGKEYYAFPRAEQLAQASEEELRALKLGYRSKYLCKTARMAADGTVNLEKIKEMSYDEARKELLQLSGVGGKVADCICLFALHKLDAFPVDTHIQKVLDTVYAGKFPFEKYKGCAGVMQQYIFYYDLKGDKQ